MAAIFTTFPDNHRIVFIWNNAAIKRNIKITMIPLKSIHARVFFTHTIIWYSTNAIIMISITSVTPIFGLSIQERYLSINAYNADPISRIFSLPLLAHYPCVYSIYHAVLSELVPPVHLRFLSRYSHEQSLLFFHGYSSASLSV